MHTIVFRVDASTKIGTGHVMRCLTLADYIRKSIPGLQMYFICREDTGNLTAYIESKGFQVTRLSNQLFNQEVDARETVQAVKSLNATIEMIIVDHYQIDVKWESEVRKLTNHILVIDDLANRKHDCDFLLDQNYRIGIEEEYLTLVPRHCKLFLGPKHLLLREEFYEVMREQNSLDGETNTDKRTNDTNILVFYGGSDPTNETEKALEAIHSFIQNGNDLIHIKVVVGASNVHKDRIVERYKNVKRFNVLGHADNMAKLIKEADLAFGAGGVNMWERCVLGLPSIATIVADNQIKSVEAAAKYGAIINMGWHTKVSTRDLYKMLDKTIKSEQTLEDMSSKASEMITSNINNLVNSSDSCAEYIVKVLRERCTM